MKIGIDMVEIARVVSILTYGKTLPEIFTEGELALSASYAGVRRNEFFAGRYAVKEAIIKALGTEWDIKLTDIGTLAHTYGAPLIQLYGKADQVAKDSGITRYNVSISHCMQYAIAMVVLE